MQYIVQTKEKITFCRVPKAEISTYKWGDGYAPTAYAQLIYVKDKGFALKMTCKEANPKAVFTNYGDSVCRDSCLEFFVSFNNKSNLYMNFEMNSAGALLSAVRTDRKNKTPIDQKTAVPTVKPSKTKDEWSVETFFSLEMINDLFGEVKFESGYAFKGNFYKCGDDTEHPHYGMWSPVELDHADFHQPSFFGDLIIQ